MARGTYFHTDTPFAWCAAHWPAELDCRALGICPVCLAALHLRQGGSCLLCGESFSAPHAGLSVCGRCLASPPPWGRGFFLGSYHTPSRDKGEPSALASVLLGVKFHGAVHQARVLGMLMAQNLELAGAAPLYDALVPVPLHRLRMAERGFNQTVELFRATSRVLKIPLEVEWLKRIRHTAHQIGKDRRTRRGNVRGAFAVASDVAGKRVLLADDVLTTGATLAEAAHALLRGGAKSVDVAAMARAPGKYTPFR